ncbi:FecR family protein, partial [Ottowia sp.]|uniref:FecR family protein n=1 Tax=Ottowia sp. TaxID=1898956 RepID=UPI0039E6C4D9
PELDGTQAPPPRRRRKPRGPGVAAVLLVAGASLLAWHDPAWRTEHVATGAQERRAVELPDGSRVELDVATRLAVSRHLRSRRVALEQGRALFEVQPSAWRPFTVDAGAASVRVLGTAFDVRRTGEGAGDEVTITVLRGRVAVTGAAGAGTVLETGGQLHAHAGQLGASATVDAADATAWRQGQLVFQRTPLAEVLAEIARYTGRPVRLADPSLAGLEVSGVYRTANTQALLALLPTFLPVVVEPQGPDGGWVVRRAPARR